MKLKGSEGPGIIPGTTNGQPPAEFTLYLSGDNSSKIEFPIDESSWDESFQSDEMPMPVETPDSHWLQVRLPWVWQQFGPDQGLKIIQMIDCEIV